MYQFLMHAEGIQLLCVGNCHNVSLRNDFD